MQQFMIDSPSEPNAGGVSDSQPAGSVLSRSITCARTPFVPTATANGSGTARDQAPSRYTENA
ncbi:MAG: hypothetical protein J4F31_03270 [Flavobacteriales bacterium]|nr:hypothetical protein [Flavobacteriales bacterium]